MPEPETKGAGGFLKKKYGGIPAWAILAGIGGLAYFWFKSHSTAAAPPTTDQGGATTDSGGTGAGGAFGGGGYTPPPVPIPPAPQPPGSTDCKWANNPAGHWQHVCPKLGHWGAKNADGTYQWVPGPVRQGSVVNR